MSFIYNRERHPRVRLLNRRPLQTNTQPHEHHRREIRHARLPYHIGKVIEKESSLLVATEEMFRVVFGIDCRTNCEAVAIDAKNKSVDLRNITSGEQSLIALAGPANRQGRIAADVICGRDSHYRGTQGTSIIGLFGGAAAWTGVSEKTLKRRGDTDHEKIYLFPNSHAGYYPGAKMIGLKVIFRKSDGKLLGAQALGEDGPAVDKRMSALAVFLQMGATMDDLAEAELCSAQRSHYATRILLQHGFAASVLSGGMLARAMRTMAESK